MQQQPAIPIDVVHLLPLLDQKLIELLKQLTPEQWQVQTIAREWKVKDVAAHLVDGNIRALSMLRDNYYGETYQGNSYAELLVFLNGLNSDWVTAMKRVSPAILVILHQATGKPYCDYYASLDPFGKAGFAVNWAGENESLNWMHIAREYTEKWLHQQQIRVAAEIPGLMEREWFYPFIDTFMMALPYTFRNTTAKENTTVQLHITGDAGGYWLLTSINGKWLLSKDCIENPTTQIDIEPDIAWRLFSKSIRPKQLKQGIVVAGDAGLAEIALQMVSVMA
jgi:uncharacterized protein (TIGR03083 family)